jgi:hypothetical protein
MRQSWFSRSIETSGLRAAGRPAAECRMLSTYIVTLRLFCFPSPSSSSRIESPFHSSILSLPPFLCNFSRFNLSFFFDSYFFYFYFFLIVADRGAAVWVRLITAQNSFSFGSVLFNLRLCAFARATVVCGVGHCDATRIQVDAFCMETVNSFRLDSHFDTHKRKHWRWVGSLIPRFSPPHSISSFTIAPPSLWCELYHQNKTDDSGNGNISTFSRWWKRQFWNSSMPDIYRPNGINVKCWYSVQSKPLWSALDFFKEEK